MNNDIKRQFEETEAALLNKTIEPEKGYRYLSGKLPFLLSAPHCVEQLREGRLKCAESRTAPLVEFLQKQTGCCGIYKTINRNDDANFDECNYYKDKIIDIIGCNGIRLVFDFHIMAPTREHNIDIGTGYGENIQYRDDLLKLIHAVLEKHGIPRVEANEMFSASFVNTISSTVARKCRIPCFQVEINWRLLDYSSPDNRIDALLDAFTDIINLLGSVRV